MDNNVSTEDCVHWVVLDGICFARHFRTKAFFATVERIDGEPWGMKSQAWGVFDVSGKLVVIEDHIEEAWRYVSLKWGVRYTTGKGYDGRAPIIDEVTGDVAGQRIESIGAEKRYTICDANKNHIAFADCIADAEDAIYRHFNGLSWLDWLREIRRFEQRLRAG